MWVTDYVYVCCLGSSFGVQLCIHASMDISAEVCVHIQHTLWCIVPKSCRTCNDPGTVGLIVSCVLFCVYWSWFIGIDQIWDYQDICSSLRIRTYEQWVGCTKGKQTPERSTDGTRLLSLLQVLCHCHQLAQGSKLSSKDLMGCGITVTVKNVWLRE